MKIRNRFSEMVQGLSFRSKMMNSFDPTYLFVNEESLPGIRTRVARDAQAKLARQLSESRRAQADK